MDNRDFFDEEYDRLSGQQSGEQGVYDSWSNYTYTENPTRAPKQRPLGTILIALLMVICIAVGWVLAVVTNDVRDDVTDGDDTRKDILNQVIDHMDFNFYQDITDAEWQLAVEQAGSALMQYAGDQYSFLMSPQTYYDYMNDVGSVLTAASNMNELFGMTYSMDKKGMLISSVMADCVSYGNLKAGDLVVKLSNIKEYIPITDAYGNLQADAYGNLLVKRYTSGAPMLANSRYTDGVILEGATTSQVGAYLQIVYSATFHVLRDGKIIEVDLARNKVGIDYDTTNINANKRYDFKFVEYYFNQNTTNISTLPLNGAATSTYDMRGLSNLPANTGYVRITQFDSYENPTDKNASTNCYSEFKKVMELFKASNLQYLVLDLKGNPGGYVHLTVNIAGLLVNTNQLTDGQKTLVSKGADSLLVTRLKDRDAKSHDYSAKSSYYNYFPQQDLANGKARIIVWTDGGSASASELLTGALLDYKTAVQMGTQTYGKGIAQTIEELDITGSYVDVNGNVQTNGKWAVYYTFASYYSPLGTNIHGVGYSPAESHQASNYSNLWTLARSYWGI